MEKAEDMQKVTRDAKPKAKIDPENPPIGGLGSRLEPYEPHFRRRRTAWEVGRLAAKEAGPEGG